MADDSRQCETCPWPLDCCSEDGATVAVDCPKEHEVWERRLGDARLALTAGAPMAQLTASEDEDKELVGV